MIIAPNWQPPCSCHACTVASVTTLTRPYAACHGRELLQWWLGYRQYREVTKALPKREVRSFEMREMTSEEVSRRVAELRRQAQETE